MARKQKPNPRQRQPVNVGLLELSLENLRKQIVLQIANNTIELMTKWHTNNLQQALEDLSAHLEWHALPWYRKVWLWLKRRIKRPQPEPEPEQRPNEATTTVAAVPTTDTVDADPEPRID